MRALLSTLILVMGLVHPLCPGFFHLFCNREAELTPELVFIFNNLTHFCGSDESEADMFEDLTTFLEREKKRLGGRVCLCGGLSLSVSLSETDTQRGSHTPHQDFIVHFSGSPEA